MAKQNNNKMSDDKSEMIQYQKGVKHLCENGIKKVPTKYILPIPDRPNITAYDKQPHYYSANNNMKTSSIKLPVIDFAELQGPNRSNALLKLAHACEHYGFFQVVNHCVPMNVITKMRDVCNKFFELPYEERLKYMSSDMKATVRYGTSFNQNKDGVFCWRDFLKLDCHPLSHKLPYWPSSPPDLRKEGGEYSKESRNLFLKLMEAILESLGLLHSNNYNKKNKDDDEILFFLKELEKGSQIMVANCYPPCPQPDVTLGMPPHSDYGFLTLLLQDQVKGLQIQFQGTWFTVDPMPNAFVVNIGDHLEIFSNGRYKSVLHRVIVNQERTRLTIASLHSLPFDQMIRPSSKLITKDNPRRYKDTNFAIFMDFISSCQPKNKDFLDSRKL